MKGSVWREKKIGVRGGGGSEMSSVQKEEVREEKEKGEKGK